jgi:hypothetical protein
VIFVAGELVEGRHEGVQQAFARESTQIGGSELKSHRTIDFDKVLAFV